MMCWHEIALMLMYIVSAYEQFEQFIKKISRTGLGEA